ncbi:MAG TPA: peptide ligase PGM1-related protein [Mycobacteriales bacterium]|nr:peptide ligase PGM1-related protein [Mycobacteriales bacterium]
MRGADMSVSYDEAEFTALQERLAPMWPGITLRTVETMSRVIVVVTSMSVEVPDSVLPVVPAYEERYLFYTMALARSRGTHVVYVTSRPVLPRLVDYYLELTTGLGEADLRSRLSVVSVGDASPGPLTAKVLARPLLIERLRQIVSGYENAILTTFMTTPLEVELALRLGVPVYGSSPALSHLGTKTGSREAFAAAGVPLPRGVCGVRTPEDVADAVLSLQADGAGDRYVVKTDEGYSGLGNAMLDVVPNATRDEALAATGQVVPADPDQPAEDYLASLARIGGIVEEWVDADEVDSPSVQLRVSPLGEVEVLSTHSQILGGRGGLAYLGCRFPAPERFIPDLTRYGTAIGEVLAGHGVLGRFAVDFVMARRGGEWSPYAIEINLRNGGTTHPALTLLALTDGTYDEESGMFAARTGPKFYVASDHLEREEYRRLTPDDVLDVVGASGISWDDDRQVGVALHMVSAVAVAGRLGATAIGDSPEHAQELYDSLVRVLDEAAGVP